MERLFIYGSLRKGQYNHECCGMHNTRFISKARLAGFKMVSLGSYPAICESKSDVVVGEVYEVPESILKPIHEMELSARYQLTTVDVLLDGGGCVSAKVYTRTKEQCQNYPQVPSGDWVTFK